MRKKQMREVGHTGFKLMIFIFFVTLISCNFKYTDTILLGTYVGVNYQKTNDTLILNMNGKYSRRVYSRKSNDLIFENTGTWKIKNNKLQIESYLVNNDELSGDFKYGNEDLFTALLGIEGGEEIKIIENYDRNLYLKKICDGKK